jgi:thiol-disulfide isomerase/thioredoxin
MVALGTAAPDFALPDAVTGKTVTVDSAMGPKGLLVMFICNHCPFVIHVRDQISAIAARYAALGVGIVAINANDAAKYPQDGPANMKALATELGWTFPFAFDASQGVAKAYRAACTPDFFVYGADKKLFYRGQMDETRPEGAPATGADLRSALDALVAGGQPPAVQVPSLGCNIKWIPGNAPDYFG